MRHRVVLSVALSLFAMLLPGGRRAGAQVSVGSTERPRASGDERNRGDDARPSPDAAARLVVTGAPRSYQVLRVEVPDAFPDSVTVSYRARSLGTASLISGTRGVLPAGGGRGVSLVIGIPARARAGRVPAAEVTFIGPGELTATIIVDMEVSLVQAMQVDVLRPTLGARPGQEVRIPYQVLNRGNARDTVRLRVDLPWGWTAAGADTLLAVESGASVQRELIARVSKMSASGSYGLRIRAMRDSVDVGADRATIDVTGPLVRSPSDAISLSTGLSLVSGANGGRTAVITYGLAGPVWGKLAFRTDFSTNTHIDARNRYRLSSLGQLPQPPNFSLYTPTWRANAGSVGFSYSDVLGQNVGGRGGSFSYDGQRYAGQLLVSRTAGTGVDSLPPNVAIRLGARVGTNWLSATAVRVEEAFGARRRLEAIGASLLAPRAFGGQLTSEVAFRRFVGGSGIGVLGDYTRIAGAEDRMQLRASFAPGGTSAFALSRSNVGAAVTRRVARRLLLDGQGWYTSDGEAGAAQSRSYGATLLPQLELSPTNVVRLEAASRAQSFASRGTTFSSGEHRLGASVRWGMGGVMANVGGSGALVTRDVGLDTTIDVRRAFTRARLFGDVTRGTVRFGSWTLSGGLSTDQSNLTTLPREGRVGVGFAQFPVYFYGGFNLRLTGLAEHISWFGARPGAFAYRGELTADLPFGFTMGWSMDRRPFESVIGAGSWATALRISRNGAFSLPAPLRRGNRSGTVYQDLNGNGARDASEPGIAGIMVLRGTERVSTDERGRYRFPAPKSGTPSATLRLEARSLPPGWLERPVPLEKEKASKVEDIGLVPTANVRVLIEVSREDLGAAGALDLAKVLVTARDSAGRLWLAAREPTGSHIFPALPPGHYRLEVDPSAVGVPLNIKDELPTFEVGQSREPRTIRVELATRKVRMFRAPASVPPAPPSP
jgi:hypothetical protein